MKTANSCVGRKVFVSALTVLSVLGCHSSSSSTPTAAPLPVESEQGKATSKAAGELEAQRAVARAPVTARLRGPAEVQAGQDIELTAEVDRNTAADQPVSLQLVLPPGARLVAGETSELLPGGNGTLARKYIVHLDQVPTTDIELVATTGNQAFGARARGAYRYGRPEPRLAEPARAPSDLVYGGRNLGRPIQLKPKSP